MSHYYNDDTVIFDSNGRLIGDLPGEYSFLDPEMRRSMIEGEFDARLYAGPNRRLPRYANTLPRRMWDGPCLIDYEHWENVCRKLRKRGVVIPLDHVFGYDREDDTSSDDDSSSDDSQDSQDTVRPPDGDDDKSEDQPINAEGFAKIPEICHLIMGFVKKTLLL
ncbi:hypothetical protein P280DRAFT_549433 [Massarina eburnea CBS 473.64]|uniref:Uncharacterized protein n=1 Tax=Massarina eburnea CBS 473.64 TaxID=1395130 RepID=A0A6A6RYJ3_9PLEO|nr:hypothetical protein P280DRAFT_549433 [Massarina eburnea CBS 473.64]